MTAEIGQMASLAEIHPIVDLPAPMNTKPPPRRNRSGMNPTGDNIVTNLALLLGKMVHGQPLATKDTANSSIVIGRFSGALLFYVDSFTGQGRSCCGHVTDTSSPEIGQAALVGFCVFPSLRLKLREISLHYLFLVLEIY